MKHLILSLLLICSVASAAMAGPWSISAPNTTGSPLKGRDFVVKPGTMMKITVTGTAGDKFILQDFDEKNFKATGKEFSFTMNNSGKMIIPWKIGPHAELAQRSLRLVAPGFMDAVYFRVAK